MNKFDDNGYCVDDYKLHCDLLNKNKYYRRDLNAIIVLKNYCDENFNNLTHIEHRMLEVSCNLMTNKIIELRKHIYDNKT